MFSYDKAFSRNIGWLTQQDQQLLRNKRIAIAGLGGVGGSHLLTLTRLGVGRFTVADFDCFELANFNRQAGAFLSTLGTKKTDTLIRMARDINPEIDVRVFEEGVTQKNLHDFIANVDLYVDGLDFFVLDLRRALFRACSSNGIPAVTAAPLGMGAALLCFMPGKMSFEDYFQLEGFEDSEQYLRFLVGLAPAILQRSYLANADAVNLGGKKGPSTAMACEICAGMAATQALKILLGRGRVLAAPLGQQFDSYRNKYVQTWRPFGNRNPIQLLSLAIARRVLKKGGQRKKAA